MCRVVVFGTCVVRECASPSPTQPHTSRVLWVGAKNVTLSLFGCTFNACTILYSIIPPSPPISSTPPHLVSSSSFPRVPKTTESHQNSLQKKTRGLLINHIRKNVTHLVLFALLGERKEKKIRVGVRISEEKTVYIFIYPPHINLTTQ